MLTPEAQAIAQSRIDSGHSGLNPLAGSGGHTNWLSDLMGTIAGLFQRFGIILAAIVLMGLGAYALLHQTTITEAAKSVGTSQ